MPLPKALKEGAAEPGPADEGSCGLCGKYVDKEEEWIEGAPLSGCMATDTQLLLIVSQRSPLPAPAYVRWG